MVMQINYKHTTYLQCKYYLDYKLTIYIIACLISHDFLCPVDRIPAKITNYYCHSPTRYVTHPKQETVRLMHEKNITMETQVRAGEIEKEKMERERNRRDLETQHGHFWRKERDREIGQGHVMEWTGTPVTLTPLMEGSVRGTRKRKRRKEGKWRNNEVEEMEVEGDTSRQKRKWRKAGRQVEKEKRRRRIERARRQQFDWQLWWQRQGWWLNNKAMRICQDREKRIELNTNKTQDSEIEAELNKPETSTTEESNSTDQGRVTQMKTLVKPDENSVVASNGRWVEAEPNKMEIETDMDVQQRSEPNTDTAELGVLSHVRVGVEAEVNNPRTLEAQPNTAALMTGENQDKKPTQEISVRE